MNTVISRIEMLMVFRFHIDLHKVIVAYSKIYNFTKDLEMVFCKCILYIDNEQLMQNYNLCLILAAGEVYQQYISIVKNIV